MTVHSALDKGYGLVPSIAQDYQTGTILLLRILRKSWKLKLETALYVITFPETNSGKRVNLRQSPESRKFSLIVTKIRLFKVEPDCKAAP
jgi:hypothetical protein